jgi:hypothetical protein
MQDRLAAQDLLTSDNMAAAVNRIFNAWSREAALQQFWLMQLAAAPHCPVMEGTAAHLVAMKGGPRLLQPAMVMVIIQRGEKASVPTKPTSVSGPSTAKRLAMAGKGPRCHQQQLKAVSALTFLRDFHSSKDISIDTGAAVSVLPDQAPPPFSLRLLWTGLIINKPIHFWDLSQESSISVARLFTCLFSLLLLLNPF